MNDEPDDELVNVHLLELPVALHVRSASHIDGLQRELELIRISGTAGADVPDRLRSLIDTLHEQYGGVGDQPLAELDAAIARGDATIDLVYRIPRSAGAASRQLRDLLDEVDEWCRTSGYLLTLVTPDDIDSYRRWFLDEFTNQSTGAPPRPWSPEVVPNRERAAPHAPVTSARAPVQHGWTLDRRETGTTITIRGQLDLVSAPALRDLLVESTSSNPITVVDLTHCTFIDSVGVSVLIAALLRADEQGALLRFRLGDVVQRVLRVSGVLDRITVIGDEP